MEQTPPAWLMPLEAQDAALYLASDCSDIAGSCVAAVNAAGVQRDDFLADYARLGAQRNAKIVGIFVRLWKRDGKPRYLDLIPRVWRLLELDLSHAALAPVARWFDSNIPAELREANGGSYAV